ncbi:hypothetical protein LCGC14_2622730 [marine sediment metagenome]|uniref:Uncharacterized protein n=1 Tax=marine sediment metagenome TaxID=412755 RepID=A0A0F9AQ87_9ZZZZ
MGNAATASYAFNTQLLHNVAGISIADDGGTSVAIRAITPTRKPIGWKHSQLPTHTISFTAVVLDDGAEVDWMRLKETKDEFTISENSAIWNRNFNNCIVQTVESSTDDDTNTVDWAITVMALSSTYATT